MSEYEANRFTTNNLLGMRQEITMVIAQKKQTNKCKENFVILELIGIIVNYKEQGWSPIHLQIF